MRRPSVSWIVAICVFAACAGRGDGQTVLSSSAKVLTALRDDTAMVTKIEEAANVVLASGPYSVMLKPELPASNDIHDYYSLAPYWWPNPDTADGLPYIRRDGHINPEIDKIPDRVQLQSLAATVDLLSMAYVLTGNETYAARAVYLLDYWFLNPATRMRPNLSYAQAERGISVGTANGVIDAWVFPTITDAINLLRGSQALTDDKLTSFQGWFATYAKWLQTSINGVQAATGPNNHGSAYDLQLAGILRFVGQTEEADGIVEQAKRKRVAVQIEGDGVQPLEVVRADSWGYSCLNLKFLTSLASVGIRNDVGLWGYVANDGGSIQGALDYLLPFALSGKRWPYPEIDTVVAADLAEPLLMAAVVFQNEQYLNDEQRLAPTLTPQLRVLEAEARIALKDDAPE